MSVLVDAGRRVCEQVETRKTAARPWEINDELWARIEPLLPVVPRKPQRPGRKRLDSRKVLCGILFVLHTGIRWEFPPHELGFGSGMTWWRRLRDWNEAGVWQRLHELLLFELRAARHPTDPADPRRPADPRQATAPPQAPVRRPRL